MYISPLVTAGDDDAKGPRLMAGPGIDGVHITVADVYATRPIGADHAGCPVL
jgi:hypothetical protein